MGMKVTDEQWEALLVAAGSRRPNLVAEADRLGLFDKPAPPKPKKKAEPKRQTTAKRNVKVEGADAKLEDDDGG
jgi:hypothetical protein